MQTYTELIITLYNKINPNILTNPVDTNSYLHFANLRSRSCSEVPRHSTLNKMSPLKLIFGMSMPGKGSIIVELDFACAHS